jgi:uncharacterized protein (TIGR02996 family)
VSAELDALLAAIRANPEDDLPRLALADWCLEQPDEATQARGEFIHLRCRAAALPEDDPQRPRLIRRARELQETFELHWLGGLDKLVADWDFERGCVFVPVTSGSVSRGKLTRLADAPGWRWVIGVRGRSLTARGVKDLVASPLLAQLTSLDLGHSEVGAPGARALATSRHAGHLAALLMGYCALGDGGVAVLVGSPHLSRLTTLALGNNGIGRDGAAALVRGAYAGRLTRLDLSRNPLGDEGARALAGATAFVALRELSLASCDLGDRGGLLLASSRPLEGLSLLDLRDNRLGEGTREELLDRFGNRLRL